MAALMASGLLFTTACRRDMQDQPRYKPLAASRFFADGRSARPVPAGTVAVDELEATDAAHTGADNKGFLDHIPAPVSEQMLHRGQDRFNIYCSPCHGRIGDGDGMVKRRGFFAPANLHTDRLRSVPPGYLFQVISNGFGAMAGYRDQINVQDRWAIVAYIRALQLARHAAVADVPDNMRAQLDEAGGGKR